MAIPPQELEFIRQRFAALRGVVKIEYFHQSESALAVPGRRPCPSCAAVKEALTEIAALADQVELRVHEFAEAGAAAQRWDIAHVPGIVVRGEVNRPLRFYGLPGGVFLPVIVGTIVACSGNPPRPPSAEARQLRKLRERADLLVLGSSHHPPSAAAVSAAYNLALASTKVSATAYAIDEFPELGAELGVSRIPTTLVNRRASFAGVATTATLVEFIHDLQVQPQRVRLAGPTVAPGSSQPWRPPAPAGTAERGPGGPRRGGGPPLPPGARKRPSGLIVPDRS